MRMENDRHSKRAFLGQAGCRRAKEMSRKNEKEMWMRKVSGKYITGSHALIESIEDENAVAAP